MSNNHTPLKTGARRGRKALGAPAVVKRTGGGAAGNAPTKRTLSFPTPPASVSVAPNRTMLPAIRALGQSGDTESQAVYRQELRRLYPDDHSAVITGLRRAQQYNDASGPIDWHTSARPAFDRVPVLINSKVRSFQPENVLLLETREHLPTDLAGEKETGFSGGWQTTAGLPPKPTTGSVAGPTDREWMEAGHAAVDGALAAKLSNCTLAPAFQKPPLENVTWTK